MEMQLRRKSSHNGTHEVYKPLCLCIVPSEGRVAFADEKTAMMASRARDRLNDLFKSVITKRSVIEAADDVIGGDICKWLAPHIGRKAKHIERLLAECKRLKILAPPEQLLLRTIADESVYGSMTMPSARTQAESEATLATFVDANQRLSKYLNATLMPHQKSVLNFTLSRPASCLFLDMGLGKTICSIATLIAVGCRRPLIIAPAALRANWMAELTKFWPTTTARIVRNTKKADTDLVGVVVSVVSYALALRITDKLCKTPFDAIVLDECHYVKNVASKRSKAVLQIVRRITATHKERHRVLLLTGTPSSRHADLYGLLRLVNSQLFSSYHHHNPAITRAGSVSPRKFYFAERYTLPEVVHVAGGRQAVQFKRSTRGAELRAVIAPYALRMLKELVVTLPPLVRSTVVIDTASVRMQRYQEAKFAELDDIRQRQGDLFASAAMMEMLRATMRAKLKPVVAYLSVLFETIGISTIDADTTASTPPPKIIIFAHHRVMLDKITQHLEENHIQFIRIDGDTKMKLRSDMLQRFERNALVNVAVLSLQACATGLNLAFASIVVYAEIVFNYTTLTQSEARAHRIGSTSKTTLQYLVLDGSTDSLVLSSHKRKARIEGKLCDGDQFVPPTFTSLGRNQAIASLDACGEDSSSNKNKRNKQQANKQHTKKQKKTPQFFIDDGSTELIV